MLFRLFSNTFAKKYIILSHQESHTFDKAMRCCVSYFFCKLKIQTETTDRRKFSNNHWKSAYTRLRILEDMYTIKLKVHSKINSHIMEENNHIQCTRILTVCIKLNAFPRLQSIYIICWKTKRSSTMNWQRRVKIYV